MRSWSLIASIATSSAAIAQPVLITTPTTINPADTTIGGVPLATAQITVEGTTLTVNGSASIASLTLKRNAANVAAVLTHAAGGTVPAGGGDPVGFVLTVSGNVFIEGPSAALPASRVDVDGRGFPSDQGPGKGFGGTNQWGGGAGHGGNGTPGVTITSARPGTAYGNVLAPALLGSGGGQNLSATPGGPGGGAVRFIVNGTFTCDGIITANGNQGATYAGGGSGGSVWINAATITGSGSISVNGGQGGPSNGGAGGGGRIALYSPNNTFSGTLSASGNIGNPGLSYAGPGTIVQGTSGSPRPSLRIGTALSPTIAATPLPPSFTIGELVVGPNAFVSYNTGETANIDATSVTINERGQITADNITITAPTITLADVTSSIDTSGRGFPAATGPGRGFGGINQWGGGAGHGGFGGRGQNTASALAGVPYGDFAMPTTPGSGGGNNDAPRPGGPGGGVIRLNTSALTVNGNIKANGAPGSAFAGGGAGGSIWIQTTTMAGSGTVSAEGGAGPNGGGGGSGGRIAVYAPTFPATPTISVLGGLTSGTGPQQNGATGTIYRKTPTATLGTLIFDAASRTNDAPSSFVDDSVVNANVEVLNNASLSIPVGTSQYTLNIAGSLLVGTNASVNADGKGFGPDAGPGRGFGGLNQWGGGGAFGGDGGNGAGGALSLGGTSYGSVSQPIEPGSGGGSNTVSTPGGQGGGALRLIVAGPITLNGTISSNGTIGATYAGGGSGGSLFITTPSLVGTGTIKAQGGPGGPLSGGGGGGGRVAVYACNFTLPFANVTATGGVGFKNGGEGSVFFGASSITITTQPTSQSFNYNDALIQLSVAATTTRPGGVTYQWRQRNGAGEFIPLTEGQFGRYFDVTQPTLTITNATCLDDATYDCLVTDSCGSFPSKPATLTIGRRIGDFDNSGGTPDVGDIDAFFTSWLAGEDAADVDGSGGTPDVSDIDIFFRAWLEGC